MWCQLVSFTQLHSGVGWARNSKASLPSLVPWCSPQDWLSFLTSWWSQESRTLVIMTDFQEEVYELVNTEALDLLISNLGNYIASLLSHSIGQSKSQLKLKRRGKRLQFLILEEAKGLWPP